MSMAADGRPLASDPIEAVVVPSWMGPQASTSTPASLASDMVGCTTEYSLDELPAPLRRGLVAWCSLYRAWAEEHR